MLLESIQTREGHGLAAEASRVSPSCSGSRALLHPLAPRLGESLAGFVARSCVHNVIERPRHVITEVGCEWFRATWVAKLPPDRAAPLAEVLGTTAEEVARRMYAPLTDRDGPPFVDFFGVLVRHAYIATGSRRIAPGSMKAADKDHHRAAWEIRPLPYCRETGTMLADRCQAPACGSPLRWLVATSAALCETCGADQRDFPTRQVPDEHRTALYRLAALVDPDPAVREAAQADLPEALRALDCGTLFELALTLARFHADGALGREAPGAATTWPVERLAHGSNMLADWPSSLGRLLEAERSSSQSRFAHTRLTTLLRKVLADRSTMPEVRALLADRVGERRPQYHERVKEHANRARLVNLTSAARQLGISAGNLIRLRQAGLLVGERITGAERTHTLFPVDDVEAIRSELERRMGAKQAMSRLNLSQVIVEQLVCCGLLRRCDHPAVELLFAGLQVDKASVDALCARVEQLTRPIEPSEAGAWLPFREAMRHVGGQEKPYGPMIHHFLEKGLTFRSVPGQSSPKLGDLLVPSNFLPNGLGKHFCFDRRNFPSFRFGDLLSEAEVSELLNCAAKDLQILYRAGILERVPRGPSRRIVRVTAEAAAQKFISTPEMVTRTGLPAQQIVRLLRVSGLTSYLSGRFWLRSAAEALISRQPIDLGQWRRRCCQANLNDAREGKCDLSDDEWMLLKPVLNERRSGMRRIDSREVINAIFWVYAAKESWHRIPERYGNYSPCFQRYRRWRDNGQFDQMVRLLWDHHRRAALSAAV